MSDELDHDTIGVGILHPPEWCGSTERFESEVAAIEASGRGF